jgi:hypothetical protein
MGAAVGNLYRNFLDGFVGGAPRSWQRPTLPALKPLDATKSIANSRTKIACFFTKVSTE